MTTPFSVTDLAAISPLWIILIGALFLLILESFAGTKKQSEMNSVKWSPLLCSLTLISALFASLYAPSSDHPLLAHWIRFDELSRFCNFFFILIGLSVTLISINTSRSLQLNTSHQAIYKGEYYFLLLTSIMGLLIIGASADFLSLFIGLETLSISLYILCGYIKTRLISHEAAMKYFLIGAFGASLLLYGIAFLYGATGTTQLNLLKTSVEHLNNSDRILFLSGMALILVGLLFKAAIVPFHAWAPDVYAGAPTPVTAFMAVGSKAGAFVAISLIFLVYAPKLDESLYQLMALLAIITLIYANFVALKQTQINRFFAYSGISNAAFLLIPIIAGTPNALQALLFYLQIYSSATIGVFAILMQLDTRSTGLAITHLKGFFYKAPFSATILACCLLTLAGIPPTAGFLSKFYIFKEAFQAEYYALVMIGLLTTILSVYYYTRIIGIMLSQPIKKEIESIDFSFAKVSVGMVALAIIGIMSIYPIFN